MPRNLLTAAKWCLVAGCLPAAALMFVPIPPASPRFLAALESNQADRMVVAVSDQKPAEPPLAEAESSEPSPRVEPAPSFEPPSARIAAAEVTSAPLSGIDFTPVRVKKTQIFELPDETPTGLVPEPTADPGPPPFERDVSDEIRELREEIARLAQAGRRPRDREKRNSESNLSEEMRRFLDELREAERFRRLEDEVQRLRVRNLGKSEVLTSEPLPAPAPPPILPPQPPGPFVRTIPSDVDPDRFSLQVESSDVKQVLDLLGQMGGWNVVAGPGVTGNVTLNLRDVTLEQALESLLVPLGLVAERRDNLLFVMTKAEADASNAIERTIVTKVYRPHYINVKDLQALATPLLTPTVGKISVTSPSQVGLAQDPVVAGGDSLTQRDALVVQDYNDVIREIDEIVREMDVPPMQVVIEAYILRVRLEDDMKFGVNFALLTDNGEHLVTSGSGAVLDTSTGFPDGRGSLVPPLAQFVAARAGLRYGFLTGNVTGFIEALERISDTSLVASPSLRVLNKQKAELIIGQRLGYKTQTFNNQQTIENVQFLDVGTKLILRPFASPDGMVRMEIHPERSSGLIDANGLPQVDTTEVTTNVMVRDGTTVVIGGLIDEQTEEDINQVPILGSIPILGYAFRNTEETIIRSELIVLITPRIVCDPVEEARGEVIRAESERRAAFFADNLTPANRRNLARFHTDRAADLYAQGRLLEARDHANHALAIRKNDGDALRLKDQIEQSLASRRKGFFSWPAWLTPSGAIPPVVPWGEASPRPIAPATGRAIVPPAPDLVPPAPGVESP